MLPFAHMNKNNQGFVSVPIIIILLVVIAGAGATSYVVFNKNKPVVETAPDQAPTTVINTTVTKTENVIPKPTANEIAGWEIYKNDKYGFQISYPSKYIDQEKFIVYPYIVALTESMDASGGISVRHIDKGEINKTLELVKTGKGLYTNSSIETISVNGITAIKFFYYPSEIEPSGAEYIFPEKEIVVSISKSGDYGTVTIDETHKHILNSIRFTK